MNTLKQNAFMVMFNLFKLVFPLMHVMAFTIIMGVLGFLAAIFILVFGALGLLNLLGYDTYFSLQQIGFMLLGLALSRGILRYLEQWTGHYIAFKLLAFLRHKIFSVLRTLTFDKLSHKEAGNYIALVTSDVELIEVFYAHTIAPIAIALITSSILVAIFAYISWPLALVATLAYASVGIALPILLSRYQRDSGRHYRELAAQMNDYTLDSVRGMREINIFGQQDARLDGGKQRSIGLASAFGLIKNQEGNVRFWTECTVSFFIVLMLAVASYLFLQGQLAFFGMLIAVILIIAGMGPVIAISSLSNNLLLTLASGERVLSLLAQKPKVAEIVDGVDLSNISQLKFKDVSFIYDGSEQEVIKDINFTLEKGKILGIYGKSGSGKTTILQLMMRFYDPSSGSITVDGQDLRSINTHSLREHISYISQQTYVFNESIYENILMARRSASKEEVIEAAKKANIHEFIEGLAKGYDTTINELSDNFSDGEKQRIGIARAFLHDAPLIILDEPTSNLDSLNEALILKSIIDAKQDKMIVLVSHRESTIAICDEIINIETGRVS